jgi:phospholipase A-2-activating protein
LDAKRTFLQRGWYFDFQSGVLFFGVLGVVFTQKLARVNCYNKIHNGEDGDGSINELLHDHHITALVSNEICYVMGCKDSLIQVFDVKTNKRLFVLKGHGKPVTSLSFLKISSDGDDNDSGSGNDYYVVSGSWDGTAKIWNLNNGECCATLDGHENTVSVQGLPPPSTGGSGKARFATGSAAIATGNSISEYKIQIYEVTSSPSSLSVTLTSTIANDHQGPIRSLSFDQKLQLLLSCSNDGSVKLRETQSGSCVQILSFPMEYRDDDFGIHFQQQSQQPPMLLDVCTNHNDSIVACGEDGNVIIWSISTNEVDGTNNIKTQIIPHPNYVWKVLTLPNNDIVTACHDGMIRIFTKDSECQADQSEIQIFYDQVKESNQKKSSGPSNDEIAKLPKWEMNHTTSGKGEGSVQVFNKDGRAMAAHNV